MKATLSSSPSAVKAFLQRHWLLTIFLLALAVRVAFLCTKPHAWTAHLQAGDEPLYHGIAVSLVRGEGYSLDGQPTARYGPGYPLFVAFIYRVFGVHPPAVRLANAVLGAFLCVLVALWAAKLWGQRAGVYAGLFATLYYPFVQLPPYLMTENLYLPLFVAATAATWWLHTAPKDRRQIFHAAVIGAMWGIAALTRSIALPLALLSAFWLGVRHWALAVTMLVGTVVALLPWTVRNYVAFNAFIPLQLSVGHDTYLAFGPPGTEPRILGHWNWGSDVQRPNPPEGLSPVARDKWLRAQAIAYIRSHPMDAVVKRIPRKLANLLTPFYGTASLINKVLSTLCYLLLLALSLPAGWRAWRSEQPSERRLAELVLLIAAFTIAFHAIFYGVVRYRYPIDALLLVLVGKSISIATARKQESLTQGK